MVENRGSAALTAIFHPALQSWIASECVLGPGAQIGEGAVIAAGAVVAHSVPAFAIAGGVPAKVLKERP